MRRGNLLEGIAAGFQNYMKTRQWGAGMQTNKLQQEQMAMTNRMREQRYGDYMSPEKQVAFDRQNTLDTDRARYEQRQPWRDEEATAAGDREFEAKKRWYDYQMANQPTTAEPYSFKESEPVYAYFDGYAKEVGLPSVSTETMAEIQGYLKNHGEAGVALGKAAVDRDALMYSKQNYDWLLELAASSPERAAGVKQAVFFAFADGQKKEQIQQEVLNMARTKAIADNFISQGHGGGLTDIIDPTVKKGVGIAAGFVAEKMPSSSEYNWRGTRR